MWTATPHLIDLCINDPALYSKEVQLNSLGPLEEILSGELLKEFKGDGIYADGSCVYHGVATYWPLVESGQFYASMGRAFGFKSELDKASKKIFTRILHLSMDFVPYGMFGHNAEVKCTNALETHWPNYQRGLDLKVQVFPLIGLGAFKSSKFAFWVRVQRKGLAAYVSDQTHFNLAAGWIQMRKLYLTDVKYDYDDGMDWPKLKKQPGVIFYADGDDFDTLKPEPGKTYKKHNATNIDSHIGHFKNKKKPALYWKNKYKLEMYGNSVITEFGVCTGNGLVMRHEIHNDSGKTLTFCAKDPDIGPDMFFECKAMGSSYPDGIVTIENIAKVVINWRLVFNADVTPRDVTLDSTEQHMAFEFGGDNYVVESKGENHIVKENSVTILAGSFKKRFMEPLRYDDHDTELEFYFDDKTMMYTL